jgi:hypothetical protein
MTTLLLTNEMKVKEGELSFCNCGGTESDGHTWACISEQLNRRYEKVAKEKHIEDAEFVEI